MYYEKHIEALTTEYEAQGVKLNVKPGGVLHGALTVSDAEDISNIIAGRVVTEVQGFRNILIPEIKEIVNTVNNAAERKKRELVVHAPDIVQYFVPAWFNTMLRDGVIEEYSPNGYLPGTVVSFPKPKLYSTFLKSDAWSKEVKEFIVRIPNVTFDRVWDLYLTDVTKNNDNILDLFNRKNITKESQYDILILLLLLLSLDGELPVGTIGTLSDVRSNIKSLRQSIIDYLVKEDKSLSESKAMLLATNKKSNTIVVNNILYKDFLTKSNVDILYGAFYNGMNVATIEQLISQSHELGKVWETVYKRINIEVKHASEIIYKSAYISVIDDTLKRKSQIEIQELTPVIRDLINGKDSDELSNVVLILEEIYGDVIYKDTNLKFFLKEVRRYGKGTDIETAVTYAVASMVATFLASQISKNV